MTENEAIKVINDKYETFFALSTTNVFDIAMATAIKALEEIKQYRAIGTVEELKHLKKYVDVINKLCSDYSAIGTIEEFKDLKEKNNEHYSDTDELDGYGYTCTNKTCVERIRNKAIDEFVKEICKKYTEEESKGNCRQYCVNIKQDIADIAEQMKAGGKNES